MLEYVAGAITRPGWAYRFVRSGIPDLSAPNLVVADETGAHLLRRVRRVDDHSAADVGGPRPGCARSGTGR